MGVLLLLWGGFAGLYGFLMLSDAKSAIHEIEAGLAFLIATVAIGSAAIIDQLRKNAKASKTPPATEPSGAEQNVWG